MQVLAEDPKDKNRAAAAKERFTRFYDLLEEVVERHRLSKVMEDDEEGRETIGDEVVRLVVPALQRFTQKQKDKEFSKSACYSFCIQLRGTDNVSPSYSINNSE